MPIFGVHKPAPEYNFHSDDTLHDQTAGIAKPGIQDIIPGIKMALTQKFNPGKLASVVKEELPKLDINDPVSYKATKGLVTKLWGSMQHPPLSYRGDEFQYRTVDGSNNNILYPSLGKAGLSYAKSIQGTRALKGARPDPGDLFDLLMARNDNGDESHVGISSLLLYMATLVIHDIFRTDDDDINKSKTSSYLDLAPLYGNTIDEQRAVRLMKVGLLKPDTFAEDRLLNQPPGVCIFIIMFNRFHNYVAQQLLEINENGKFALPPGYSELATLPEDERTYKNITKKQLDDALRAQDEDLFQTSRLITCGLYGQIAIHDYLRCLMRMHEKDTPWTLDPRKPYPEDDNAKGLQRGEGNMVSVEFNMLYRFHSPLSERDRWWSEEAFIKLLQMKKGYVVPDTETVSDEDVASGKKITEQGVRDGEVPVPVFQHLLSGLKGLARSPEYKAAKDGPCWPEGLDRVSGDTGDPRKPDYRFKRDPKTGKFDDAQLAAEMIRVIEDPICHFGARHIPKVFRSIEILGILQSRKWELATLNEFREFFGMSRHKNFEDVNTDPEIQTALRDLYEDPDQIELYPGVYCEGDKRNLDPDEKMPNDDGAALWRGIFSDAVTLVRSDRFYTIDWNVHSLTSWGLRELVSDPKVNKGSCFHRLFQRALPGYFTYNSIHMWQPFFTPVKNAYLALEQGYLDQLDLSNLEWVAKGASTGTPADHKSPNFYAQIRACYPDVKKTSTRGLRRKLRWDPKKDKNDPWRGNELATLAADPIIVSSYEDIKDKILGGATRAQFINPANLEPKDIPDGPLRKILTNQWSPWPDVLKIVGETLNKYGHDANHDKFLDYFVGLAGDIRLREERSFQYLKGQSPWEQKRTPSSNMKKENEKKIKQIDIVKDFSIPIVTRFFADLLGFYDRVKTDKNKQALSREFTENQIYEHLQNCQNFTSYDLDRTKTWERRQAFKNSIQVLHDLTQYGIGKSEKYTLWPEEPSLFSHGRYYGDMEEYRDQPYVIAVRKLGVKIVQALGEKWGRSEVVAIMLVTALDAAQKVVLTFTEVLSYFVDPKQQEVIGMSDSDKAKVFDRWGQLQKLARQDTAESNDMIRRHVLEAQRLTHTLKVVRVYTPGPNAPPLTVKGVKYDKYGEESKVVVQSGDTILLDLYAASHDPNVWENPDTFDLNRKTAYLTFGNNFNNRGSNTAGPTFSQQLSLTATTGMLKHAATLKYLRVAHDKLGRLKKVKTPNVLQFDLKGGYTKVAHLGGLERYCSSQWNMLLPAPVTWNLRYDNVGEGVYRGRDNADQGHGMNQLDGLITPSDTKTNGEKPTTTSSDSSSSSATMNGNGTTTTTSYTSKTSTIKSPFDRAISLVSS